MLKEDPYKEDTGETEGTLCPGIIVVQKKNIEHVRGLCLGRSKERRANSRGSRVVKRD